MAIYISVYDDTNEGPKFRDLDKQLRHISHGESSSGETLSILIFLWKYGMRNAERSGKLICTDKDDLASFFDTQNRNSKLDHKLVVQALIATGWLEENKSNSSLIIHDWDEWQEPWYKAKERREKDAERKREESKRKREMQPSSASPAKDQKPDYQSDDNDGFLTFWDKYPRKDNKGYAYKKYLARIRSGYTAAELLFACEQYAAECKREGTERKYIKLASTFLSDSLPFTDYLKKGETPTGDKYAPVDGDPYSDWED